MSEKEKELTAMEWINIGKSLAIEESKRQTITKEYQYLYFFIDENKKIPVVTSATRDLNLAVFPDEEIVGKIMKDFNIKTDLFVWIDGTEFLVKTN